jgi:hypothetical protein
MNEAQIVQTDFDGLLANCGSIDAVSWKAPQGMDFVRWAEIGQKFQLMSGSLNWWIGDWLNEGERRYGETYTQAIELTGHKLEYLQQCKWISSAVKTCTRVQVLSWTHHRYVAHLPGAQEITGIKTDWWKMRLVQLQQEESTLTGVWIRTNDDTPEQVYDKVTQIFPAEWTVRFYQLVAKGAM